MSQFVARELLATRNPTMISIIKERSERFALEVSAIFLQAEASRAGSYLQPTPALPGSHTMEKYRKLKTLGRGSFGAAILVRRVDDNREFVIKRVDLSRMQPKVHNGDS